MGIINKHNVQDVEETEEYRLQKQKETEKSNLSGKKSRRERKMLKVSLPKLWLYRISGLF